MTDAGGADAIHALGLCYPEKLSASCYVENRRLFRSPYGFRTTA